MKIRIIRPYKDTLLDRHTKINEIIEVTPNRLKELQERVPTFIEIVEMPTEVITTIENATYIEVSKKNIEDIKEEVKGSVIAQPYQPLPYKNDKPKTTTKKKVAKK